MSQPDTRPHQGPWCGYAPIVAVCSLFLCSAIASAGDCNGNGIDDGLDIAGIEPLAYWRFEEAGGPFFDSGPNDLTGTGTSADSIADVPVDPVPKTTEANFLALELGGDGSVLVPDPDDALTLGGASFTIEAWVQLDHVSDTSSASQRQFLLQKKALASGGALQDYSMLVQAGTISSGLDENFGKTGGFTGRELVITFGTGSETWGVTSNLQIRDTEWHAVSVAFDAATDEVRFGLDGAFETIDVSPPGFHANDGPLLVGAHTNAAGSFNQFLRGAIDELRFADEVVSVDQLLASYVLADCNGNGVPDVCDIADGTGQDCDGDGQLDGCDLVDNDCDGNGIPDQCDPDCNGNGTADACDIADGTSLDCQPDGIPDDCQLDDSIGLFYDNGFALIAWRTDETHMAWLNRFNVADGAGIVDAIDVDWGVIPLGTQVDAYVWSDPNGDGDPTDAQVLWSQTVTVLQTNAIRRIDVPDIDAGSTGASFFVGFIMPVTDQDFPASLDISGVPVPDRSWGIGTNGPIDPNDLSAGAIEFGTVNNLLFGNVFIIRAQMRGPGNDCNVNGTPDDCEIGDGTSADLDGNGVPDECDDDCNGNGTLDGFDVTNGTSADCNGDGVPDECQLPANDCNSDGVPDDCQLSDQDCNGNGILDACDLASGFASDIDASGVPDECEDCNGNDVPDSIDIDGKFSEDCNGDGVPDECQFGAALDTMRYTHDDGVQESNLNFIGGSSLEFAWMNHFTVQPDGEWISAIEVVWGDTYPDLPAEVVLWSDPDGDGNPADAQVIITVKTRTMKVNAPLDNLNVVPIPPTYIGPEGTSFFVGVYFDDTYNSGAFIALDRDEPVIGGWIVYDSSGSLDLNDLGSALASLNWTASNLLVRAIGSAGTFEHDCNTNETLDACDIASRTSDDVNANDVPDECECIGDIDGNGDIGFDDLLVVLSGWGPCPGCPAELTGDDVVGFDDLLVVLSGWGRCP